VSRTAGSPKKQRLFRVAFFKKACFLKGKQAFLFKGVEFKYGFEYQYEKGKPSERVGRKATGLSPEKSGYGSRVAVEKIAPPRAVSHTEEA